MHKLKEKLMDILYEYEDKAARSGDAKVSDSEIQKIHIITDTIKNIDKIDALEGNSEYSDDDRSFGLYYDPYYRDGQSGRRGRGRGRNARRDSMGRYASDGSYYRRGGSYGDNPSYMPYYRDNSYGGDDKDEMLRKLRGMIGETEGEEEKEALRQCIRQLEEM